MLREDFPVWFRFLAKYDTLFREIYYDVLVGGPYLTPDELKDPLKRMWQYNNSKRLDAVIKVETETWLVEVSSRPGLRAIGQLMAYVAMWQDDDPFGLIERPILVCEFIDTDLIHAASKYGISTYVV